MGGGGHYMNVTQDREQAARRSATVALRTASAIMGNRDDAADVAQDVVVDVLRSLSTLKTPEAFDAWVYRITVRHTLRALRKRKAAQVELPLALGLDVVDRSNVDADPDLVLSARAALGQALLTLPPKQRVAIALRYVHDLTDREIAEAMGCRRGTVNALLSRARASLREVPALRALAIPADGGVR